MTDTEAGTPLTAEEAHKRLTAIRNTGTYRAWEYDRLARDLIDALAARSRPATDPAGLDALAAELADSPRARSHTEETDAERSTWRCVPLVEAVEAAARLSVADGPGPEERRSVGLRERLPGAADRPANEAAVVAAVGDHEVRDDPSESTTTPA